MTGCGNSEETTSQDSVVKDNVQSEAEETTKGGIILTNQLYLEFVLIVATN